MKLRNEPTEGRKSYESKEEKVMVNNTFQSKFDDYKTMNEATVTVDVEMNPSKLMAKVADEISLDMSRIGSMTGISNIGVESEEILRYLKTLTAIRVSLVRGDQSKAMAGYNRLARYLSVPVMPYQALISMGIAIDRDYSIKFQPVYSIDSKDLLSPDDMERISDIMLRLEPNGFKIVQGVPRDVEGELDFMALSHVEDIVKGYRKSHPVYGFLAAFFAQHTLNEITGTMCRIVYGYESDYATYVTSLYQAMTK